MGARQGDDRGLPDSSDLKPLGRFVSGTFQSANGTRMPYQLFIPPRYGSKKVWPIIVALHGGGERGTDGLKQMTAGLAPVVKARADNFPALVLFPQMAEKTRGPELSAVIVELLDEVMKTYRVDATRQYLTGYSFGGFVVYDMAYRNPERFAALVPISAMVVPGWIAEDTLHQPPANELTRQAALRLRSTPVWAFHGGSDTNVPVSRDRTTAMIFQQVGSPFKYSEFEGQPHDVWGKVYALPEMWEWLFRQHRGAAGGASGR